MENNNAIIDLMKQIGLSEYESKAYLSLLKSNPANGYKLSISSNIPRSRIYEVLNRLILKQMVYIHPNWEKKYYVPVEPEIVLRRIQNQFTVAIKKIETYAQSIRIVNHK
ncbi:helix-turn-helix domain-containing protein [Desulfospira joergensenii]|uniref:TrmB family transcriptional regulator n=1 Tax=Desulfospira joergensenii TaxID=53329 RepID=UPI0003B7778E